MKKQLSYKKILLTILVITLSGCTINGVSVSPPESSSAVVWKGFHFDWTYNHRLKEFQSSVFPSTVCSDLSACTSGVRIASQRGLGPDTGVAKHFFSIVTETDNDITFFTAPGNQQVITGTENVVKPLAHEQSITIPSDSRGYDRYYVFFNGFHLLKNDAVSGGPENLISYALNITNPEFSGASSATSLPVVIDGLLNMATESPEIILSDPFNNRIDYLLDLEYLVVGVNDEAFEGYNTMSQSNDIEWGRPTVRALNGNPQPQDEEIQFSEIGQVPMIDGLSPASVNSNSGLMTGITGFSINIATVGPFDHPSQHMLSWYMALSNEGRTVEDERGNSIPESYQGQADLFFKNWRVGMRSGSIAPFYDSTSYGSEGSASMSLSVGKLDFRDDLQHHDTVNSVDCNLPGRVDHLAGSGSVPSVASFSYSPTSLACPRSP